jgi:histidine ammonia-lyase
MNDGRTSDVVEVGGDDLTCRDVAAVARRHSHVAVTAAGLRRAAAAYAAAARIAADRAVYGRTTGVGANRTVAAAEGHGVRLLRSHAGGAGPAVPADAARAMLVVRLNQLARGGAGVDPELLGVLATAINDGRTPPLRHYGAIGTGDLTALATTALCILGEREWDGGPASPYRIDDADALAFISSNAATIGAAALVCVDLARSADTALIVAALSAVAAGASPEPYAAAVQRARPHPGQVETAARMRTLLGGDLGPDARVQDSYGFRAIPQVHGPVLDAAGRLEQVITIELNSAAENPLIDAQGDRAWHNGNFHGAYLGLALDHVGSAVAQAATLSVARLAHLMAGPPAFLATCPSGSSGLMILEYIAHAALTDVRHRTAVLSGPSVTLSLGTEDHASFSTQSAQRLGDAVRAYSTIVACELVAAMRALRLSGRTPPAALHPFWRRVIAVIGDDTADRPLDADLDAVLTLLGDPA